MCVRRFCTLFICLLRQGVEARWRAAAARLRRQRSRTEPSARKGYDSSQSSQAHPSTQSTLKHLHTQAHLSTHAHKSARAYRLQKKILTSPFLYPLS